MAGDAKFKLEDILNKQKAPPQILDLANIKIETEEEFKNVIEKIPDYRIKPERVSQYKTPLLHMCIEIAVFIDNVKGRYPSFYSSPEVISANTSYL